ncbi:hypothetical protein SLI_8016 [Streptomyces lividans 1326]|uniref:Uncharacterized protein n=1 Tax=Streptomyces lividans 1326 TaxID=1200984 RepID=A0A7U9DYX8_STRLI|nr:hypothetical protein SLI_8016 [Streptomyces lividans 1326]
MRTLHAAHRTAQPRPADRRRTPATVRAPPPHLTLAAGAVPDSPTAATPNPSSSGT